MNLPDFKIVADQNISRQSREKGLDYFHDLIKYVQQLPYGRTANRADYAAVLTEGKGTCSTKHALLKKVAMENHISAIELLIGIYRMNHVNTPGIGNNLMENNLDYLPEAHCYLKYNNYRIDITNVRSDFSRIENDILEEVAIDPYQIDDFKINYHQNYLKQWIRQYKQQLSFPAIWKIREACIRQLSENED